MGECRSSCPSNANQNANCVCTCQDPAHTYSQASNTCECRRSCPSNANQNTNCVCTCQDPAHTYRQASNTCECRRSCPSRANQNANCGCICQNPAHTYNQASNTCECPRSCPSNANQNADCGCICQNPAHTYNQASNACECPRRCPSNANQNANCGCICQNPAHTYNQASNTCECPRRCPSSANQNANCGCICQNPAHIYNQPSNACECRRCPSNANQDTDCSCICQNPAFTYNQANNTCGCPKGCPSNANQNTNCVCICQNPAHTYNQVTNTCECPAGKYDLGCTKSCNENCGGDGSCHDSTGACGDGCKDGYRGDKCTELCESGKYGKACNSTCSLTCLLVENNNTQSPCHHVNGNCKLGCQARYEGDLCLTEKQDAGDDQDDLPIVAIIVPIVIVIALIVAIIIGVLVWRRLKHPRTPDSLHSMPPTHMDLPQENSRQFSKPESKNAAHATLKAQSPDEAQYEELAKPMGHYENLALSEVLPESSPYEEIDGFELVKPQLTVPPINPKPPVTKRTQPWLLQGRKEKYESRQTKGPYYNTVPALSSTSIAVRDLDEFMLSHGKEFFIEQFHDIPANKDATTRVAISAENKMKNRYRDICAYDHSRVHLLEDSKKEKGGYINASYIEGINGEEKFIASQDPTQAILVDFVRMLWEQSVEQLVMLTNLIEDGTMKCIRYWPEKGEMDVGEIKVRLRTTQVFADYTIRGLQLSKTGEPAKEITQFHFTTWTDKEVPPAPWALVDFELRVASFPTDMPIVVHCSNGVGRTGTFIALRNVMRQAEVTGHIDFVATVQKLRVDRINMVQTAEQYEFLHKAAQAAMPCMGTTVTPTSLQEQMKTLSKTAETGKTNMEREFQIICRVSGNSEDDRIKHTLGVEEEGRKIANKRKNHANNVLPKDLYRVRLIRDSDQLGDYINAVFAPSFTNHNQQILTCLPLPTTVTDFWHMVTQCQVSLIVAFDVNLAKKDLGLQTSGEYLPEDDGKATKLPPFCIQAGPVSDETLFRTKKIIITTDAETASRMSCHASFNKECHVTHLRCKISDLDPAELLALAMEIRLRRPVGQGRTLLMCRNGADFSGLMCVILLLLDRMDHDQYVSVPLVVGALKAIRPQVIPTVDQYKLLYEILKLHIVMGKFYRNVSDTQTDKTATDKVAFEGSELDSGRVGHSFL